MRARGGVEQGSRAELLFWFAIDSLTTELEDLQLCNNRGPLAEFMLGLLSRLRLPRISQ